MKITKKDECSYSVSNAIRTLAKVTVTVTANDGSRKTARITIIV